MRNPHNPFDTRSPLPPPRRAVTATFPPPPTIIPKPLPPPKIK